MREIHNDKDLAERFLRRAANDPKLNVKTELVDPWKTFKDPNCKLGSKSTKATSLCELLSNKNYIRPLPPHQRKDEFTVKGRKTYIFSPSNANMSMMLLPKISKKAQAHDPRKFEQLTTTFIQAGELPKESENYIVCDEDFKPSTKDKFDVYMEYLDDEDLDFPQTVRVIESVEQDRINRLRKESENARQAVRQRIGVLRRKGFSNNKLKLGVPMFEEQDEPSV